MPQIPIFYKVKFVLDFLLRGVYTARALMKALLFSGGEILLKAKVFDNYIYVNIYEIVSTFQVGAISQIGLQVQVKKLFI